MSNTLVVGISDCAVSAEPGSVLVTYALGSCIGLALHDPVARVGGLLHFMLPLAVLHPRGAEERPFMYCDSALPLMLNRMTAAGAERARLVARAAGGAQMLNDRGFFDIGSKNEQILRRMLAAYKLPLAAAEFGGNISRTVGLEVASGRFWIKNWQTVPADSNGNGAAPQLQIR